MGRPKIDPRQARDPNEPEQLPRGVFERPKGSGVYWVRWADSLGKEHREKAGTVPQALSIYNLRKAQVLTGQKLPHLGKRELTLGDLVDKYLPEFQANKKSSAWDERYGKYWKEKLGEWPLPRIKPGDVERLKASLLATYAPGSVNRRLAFLKSLFGKAVRDGLAETNPLGSGRVKMLDEPPGKERILSPEEEAVIGAKLPPLTGLAWTIYNHTGLRRNELLERKRTDVDLKKALISIPRAKGGNRQHVSLNAVALEAARQLLSAHSSPWLLPGPSGASYLSEGGLNSQIRKACDDLGFPDVSLHTCRHTFISRLVMLGIPIVTVQRLARHKSIQMTLRYAHLYPDHASEALDKLAASYPGSKCQPAPIPAPKEMGDQKSQ